MEGRGPQLLTSTFLVNCESGAELCEGKRTVQHSPADAKLRPELTLNVACVVKHERFCAKG